MDLRELLEKVAKDVDKFIYENVVGTPRHLYDAALHIIRAGGKRVRPAILVASGLALGGDYARLIPYASAVELVHTFTLIHDDIMDNDDFRRGVETVHRKWGVPVAITAGDLLFSKAFEVPTSSELSNNVYDHLSSLRAVNILSRAASTVAEGQALDMMFEEKQMVTETEYLDMVYRKTAALIEASSAMGAVLAGASDEDVELMKRYGRNIGIAFQIKDDILGIYGDPEVTGKPVYSDLREGKKTLLLIRAMERGSEELRKRLQQVLGNRNASTKDFEEVATMIEDLGIRRETELEAYKLAEEAISELNSLKGVKRPEYIYVLKELATFIVSREK